MSVHAFDGRRALAVRIALAVCALATSAICRPAAAQESKITMSILGFNADASTMLVKLDDVNTGLGLRVYDVDTGKPAKKSQLIPYIRADEIKTVKDVRKKNKITDPGLEDTMYPLDPADETKTLSFFGVMAAKDRFVLAVTDKKKLGKIKDVDIRKDEETGTLAKAAQKTIFWTTDRKTMVVIVTQKLDTGAYSVEGDEFHAVRFKPDEIQWVEGDPPPEEKKEEKKEEPKKEKHWWWPFG